MELSTLLLGTVPKNGFLTTGTLAYCIEFWSHISEDIDQNIDFPDSERDKKVIEDLEKVGVLLYLMYAGTGTSILNYFVHYCTYLFIPYLAPVHTVFTCDRSWRHSRFSSARTDYLLPLKLQQQQLWHQ